jgi:hypothetical protein
MTLFAQYFIPCKQFYMFRVKHSPIIRSTKKLELQHLLVTNSMRPADVVDESEPVPTAYTGCPRRNVPDFGRVFLMLKYTDVTQNTYIQS